MRLFVAAVLAVMVMVVVAIVAPMLWTPSPLRVEPAPPTGPASTVVAGDIRTGADAVAPGRPWTGTIEGIVVDTAGLPVAEVGVAVAALASQITQMARTDANGAFALRDLPQHSFCCVLRHPEFLPANVPVDAATPQPLRLLVRRAPLVRGRIVDAADRPVVAFCVALVAVGEEQRPLPATPPPDASWQQREDGRFEVRAATAGRHDLQIFTARGRPVHRRLELAPEAVVDEVIRVADGVRIGGVARDADGDPVAFATVRVQLTDGQEVLAPTDVAGVFALPPLGDGAATLTVEPVEGPVSAPRVLELGAATHPFVEVQLPRGAAASGSVQPWQPGQRARVLLAHARGPMRYADVDAATGAFAIAELTPGTHAVWVERLEPIWRHRVARLLFDQATAPTVELAAGTTVRCDVTDISATMARVRGRLAGQAAPERLAVRAFAEDRRLPERALGLLRATPTTDGAFELDGLLPGRWRLQAMLGDAVVGWDTVELDAATDVEFVLRLGGQRR